MEPQALLSSMRHVMSNLGMNIYVKLMVHIYIRWESLSDDYKGHLCRRTIILVKMAWTRFWLKFLCPFLNNVFVTRWVLCHKMSNMSKNEYLYYDYYYQWQRTNIKMQVPCLSIDQIEQGKNTVVYKNKLTNFINQLTGFISFNIFPTSI